MDAQPVLHEFWLSVPLLSDPKQVTLGLPGETQAGTISVTP
jgi:hypothetical protein